MSCVSSHLIKAIHTRIHPLVLQTILVDRQVGDRLPLMTEIEKRFQEEFGETLFLHFDMEDGIAHYDITSLGVSISCKFNVK